MSSLAEVLAGLQKSYLASLPEKIANLELLFTSSELVKLETEYHKLKGTGRTYGLPEVTEIGALVERLCQVDPSALKEAVPLSLILLAKTRQVRENGEPLVLDTVSEFQSLNRLVTEAESKAG